MRVAYRPAQITINAVTREDPLITVMIERMELDEAGNITAKAPADRMVATKASELSGILPGIVDGDQVRQLVEALANNLIASELSLSIGASGYAEE